MKKKKLESLSIFPREQMGYKQYEFVPHIELLDNLEYLVVEIYYSRNSTPTYRLFINDIDYDTLDINRQIWTHKDVLELIGKSYTWIGDYCRRIEKNDVLISRNGIEILKYYIEKRCGTLIQKWEKPGGCIAEYQERLRIRKLTERNNRVTNKWDEQIGFLPELPSDWEEFLEKEVVKEHYVFFQKTGKETRGVCQHCKGKVFEKVRHNEKGICPHCKKRVRMINVDRKKCWCDHRHVWIAQKEGERIIVRIYMLIIKYEMSVVSVKIQKDCYPESMVIFDGEKQSEWIWGKYKRRGECRWCSKLDAEYQYYTAWKEGCMYRMNAEDWKKETSAKYLPLELLPYEENVNPALILKNVKTRVDAAEKLMKIGLWNLGINALKGIISGDKLKDILKVENDDLEILKNAGADINQYKFFQVLKKAGKRPSVQELEQYYKMNMPLAVIEKMIPYTTFHQIYKRYRHNSEAIIKRCYMDYFNMCRELKFDMRSSFVLFPKNIRKAHDDLVLYYNEKKDEIEGKKRNRIYAKVKDIAHELNRMYGVEDGEYLIRAPRDAAEIIKEGHAMHHCVGGQDYTEKMVKGVSYILFIRKKSEPEKSWYTIEMRADHTVAQVHGFANGDKDRIRTTSIWKLLQKRLADLKMQDNTEG